MFDELSSKLQVVAKKITNRGFLNEENTESALQETKIALLEADVNFRVVGAFIKKIKERCQGKEIIGSLSPGQQLIQFIYEELTSLLGEKKVSPEIPAGKTFFILLLGLQGSGKTTTAAKLALKFKNEQKKTLLVPADIYRPAAIEQLQILAKKIDVDVFSTTSDMKVVEIAEQVKQRAEQENIDVVIVDTAGRLQIDEQLMQELEDLKKTITFQDTLLVLDAMTGQEALNIAKTFHQRLDISGFILSKMDGDARGGAAVSIRVITEKPIRYVGSGEKVEDLEEFHPDRVASKILGMGDVLTLAEKVSKQFEGQDLKSMEQRMKENQFNLLDFELQLQQISKMGSLKSILSMMPGFHLPQGAKLDTKPMQKFTAILSSMTKQEKIEYSILNGSRRKRIAKGSGTEVSDVNQMLKQFTSMKKMMKQMSSGGKKQAMQQMQQMMGGGVKIPF